MDMSINQRLGKFLFEKKISQEELRIKLGLKTRQQVSNWVNCQDPIPDKHIIGIIRLFPELNSNWLIRDVGDPIVDQKSLRQINRNEFGFCDECVEKEKEIKMLRASLEKKEQEVKESYRELGKLEERIARYELLIGEKSIREKDSTPFGKNTNN
ncbi:MAG: hypothetical protein RR397_03780 [Odoribacter sp.]